MAKKKQAKGPVLDLSVEFDMSELVDESEGLVLLQDSVFAEVKDWLPTFFPKLDRALGGGLPFGRMIEIAGIPSGGKSTMTHHIMRVAQKLGCIVVLIDVEGTSDKDRLTKLGIDTRRIIIKEPSAKLGRPLTVEEVGKTVEKTLKTFEEKAPNRPIIYIWDSIGQTPSKVQYDKDFGEKDVGAKANALTQLCTKVAPLLAESKAIFVGINQVRDDIGGMSFVKQYKVTGGKAWEHAMTQRWEVKQKKAIKKTIKGKEERIGHTAGIRTRKNKVARPMQEEDIYLIADTGFDYEYNMVHQGIDAGIAKQSGQSYVYIDLKGTEHKMQTARFLEWLRDDEEGNKVRAEILNRLIWEEFGSRGEVYPALNNSLLTLDNWIDPIYDISDITPEEGAEEDDDDDIEIDSEQLNNVLDL
ncbi:putative DNA recombination and repair protein RecA [Bacillus phage BPS10C]|uniref:Putative DNA recombination and repair protein RecA n=1 Tax=Bacillus phage BPS10C TaxID=1277886 RepID=W5QUD2_9CAUD|nr:UvsX-like recombinase [Bacillus phage BPS10C]AGI12175.1 putative DNA recombination and repair protein RecA [Bacillus phage BPS10C]